MQIDVNGILDLSLPDLIGERIGLLGVSGSGKSNTLKVLVEEIALSAQRPPMTIIDPEGEYWPLKAVMDCIVIGEEGQSDVACDVAQAASLARFSVEQGVSVILSLIHLSRDEMNRFVEVYLDALWKAIIAQSPRRPYLLLVEEAHEFAPQSRSSPVGELLISMAKRGRKHGLGLMVSTQRPAAISKDVLTQTTMLFLHQVTYPVDLAVYKSIVPMKPAEVEACNQALEVGQAMIVRDSRSVSVVQVRRCATFDAGSTPGLNPEDLPALRSVDSAMLAELKSLFEKAAVPERDPEKESLRRQLADLAQINDELAANNTALLATVERQNTVIETLGAIRITVDRSEEDGSGHGSHAPSRELTAREIAVFGDPRKGKSRPAVEPEPVQTVLDIKSTLTGYATEREQRAFNILLRDIDTHTAGTWKAIYAYLLVREGEEFSFQQLCRRLAYKPGTLRSDTPHILYEEGLMQRRGTGDRAVYRATTRETLVQKFPNMNADALMHRVLEVVGPKRKVRN